MADAPNTLKVEKPKRTCKERCSKKLWIRVIIIVLVGIAAFFIAYEFIPQAANPPGISGPDIPEIVVLSAAELSEGLVLGTGIAFLVTYAKDVHNAPPKIKKKVVIIYICITYLLIQWWPHAAMHRYFGFSVAGLVILEYSFHIPNNIALTILAYYQFQIILLCMALKKTRDNLSKLEKGEATVEEEKKEKKKKRSCWSRFWCDTKVHIAIIVIGFFFPMYFAVQIPMNPDPAPVFTDAIADALLVLNIESSIFFGVGASFAILMAIKMGKNIAPEHRKPAWVSYAAICYIFLTDWFHGRAHLKVQPGDWWGLIAIEIVFHMGLTAAGLILCHYQRKVITGARKKAKATSVTLSTQQSKKTDKSRKTGSMVTDGKTSTDTGDDGPENGVSLTEDQTPIIVPVTNHTNPSDQQPKMNGNTGVVTKSEDKSEEKSGSESESESGSSEESSEKDNNNNNNTTGNNTATTPNNNNNNNTTTTTTVPQQINDNVKEGSDSESPVKDESSPEGSSSQQESSEESEESENESK